MKDCIFNLVVLSIQESDEEIIGNKRPNEAEEQPPKKKRRSGSNISVAIRGETSAN